MNDHLVANVQHAAHMIGLCVVQQARIAPNDPDTIKTMAQIAKSARYYLHDGDYRRICAVMGWTELLFHSKKHPSSRIERLTKITVGFPKRSSRLVKVALTIGVCVMESFCDELDVSKRAREIAPIANWIEHRLADDDLRIVCEVMGWPNSLCLEEPEPLPDVVVWPF